MSLEDILGMSGRILFGVVSIPIPGNGHLPLADKAFLFALTPFRLLSGPGCFFQGKVAYF
jgi:hypothetical protein